MLGISTRNQYPAHVACITRGPVNSELVLSTTAGEVLVAVITNGACDDLNLCEGGQVTALVNSSAVFLALDDEPLLSSARNRVCGVVSNRRLGAINGEVTITARSGLKVVATVTNESHHCMGLLPGREVCALFKASSVVVAVET